MCKEVAERQAKWKGMFADPRWIPKYDHKIPISWVTVLICISAGSPECPLSYEVWWHALLKETTKWQAERLRHLLFSPHSSIVLLSVLHSEVHLGSAYMPPHFGLSLCNALEQISPTYPIWKGTSIALIWGIVACPAPRIYTDMARLCECVDQPS